MSLFSKYNPHQPVTFAEAQSIWGDEHINSPAYHKFGLYNTDDMNTGGFLWFDSKEDLQFFLFNVWPVVLAGEGLEEPTWNKWKENAELSFRTEIDVEKIIRFINEYWNGDINIGWIGSLEELETSDCPTSNEIREWFHETTAPISAKDNQEFHAFIQDGFC